MNKESSSSCNTEKEDMNSAEISEDRTACEDGRCYCHKTKERSEKEYRDLMNRLNRISGQINGIKGMVERSAYCIDIITQVSAATTALNSFTKVLLGNHIRTCVAEDIREGRSDSVEELVSTLQKLMR